MVRVHIKFKTPTHIFRASVTFPKLTFNTILRANTYFPTEAPSCGKDILNAFVAKVKEANTGVMFPITDNVPNRVQKLPSYVLHLMSLVIKAGKDPSCAFYAIHALPIFVWRHKETIGIEYSASYARDLVSAIKQLAESSLSYDGYKKGDFFIQTMSGKIFEPAEPNIRTHVLISHLILLVLRLLPPDDVKESAMLLVDS